MADDGCSDCCCLQCVRSKEIGIVEHLGKYDKLIEAGPHCIMFPFTQVTTRMSLRVRMLEVQCETKTKDNVFCQVKVAVMYRVKNPVDAYYKLSDEKGQLRSYVNNVIRSSLPKLELDQAFVSKDDIAEDTEKALQAQMNDFGFEIIKTLVVDIEPDRVVKASMNDINAAQRMRKAAAEKAEAEKILFVKAAEADADSKYLSGQGVARQRTAIVNGLRSTVADYTSEVAGTSATDVLDLLLVTQYFDMMKEVSSKTEGTTLFLNHEPTAVAELRAGLRANFMNSGGKKSK